MSKLINYVAIVTDRSGSMESFQRPVVEQFNSQIAQLKSASEENSQITIVSLYFFDTHVERRIDKQPIASINPLTARDYVIGDMTALYDAIGQSIEDLDGVPGADHPDVSFLIIVLTDGLNNRSCRFTSDSIRILIERKMATDRWTFVGICPAQYRIQLTKVGFYDGNVQSWDVTKGTAGYVAQAAAVGQGLRGYVAARASGAKSSSKFFSDLSAVTQQDVQASTHEVTNVYTEHTVPKERTIKDFVEEKTKRPYIKGEALYLLSKTEKVQDYKEIVIKDKKTKKLYGGAGARQLLGLPAFGEVRVHVGIHGNYDVYVQSTSVNRILVRGSSVLVRK